MAFGRPQHSPRFGAKMAHSVQVKRLLRPEPDKHTKGPKSHGAQARLQIWARGAFEGLRISGPDAFEWPLRAEMDQSSLRMTSRRLQE